jgi:WD40 repeat protein
VLDEVLLGLPEKYRRPVVECHLEGRSRKEAAARLGWSEGTLSGRLARALDLMAARLTRRGVGPSAGALAGVLVARPLRATVPEPLAASTVSVAGLLADGLPVPAGLAALSKGGLNAMWWGTWRTPALGGLAASLLVVGAAVGVSGGRPDDPPATAARAAPPAASTGKRWVMTKTLTRDHPVTVVSVGPDGALAVGDADGGLALWRPGAKDPAILLKGVRSGDRPSPIVHLTFTPDGTYLYAIIGWQTTYWCELGRKDHPGWWVGTPYRGLLGISPDGRTSVGKQADEKKFELHGNEHVKGLPPVGTQEVELDAEVTSVGISVDGQLVVAVTADGAVRLIDRESLFTLWAVECRELPAAVRFSPDGKRLAIAGAEGYAAVYDTAAGTEVARLKGHDGTVHAASLSPDGKLVATAGHDKTARVWAAATGKQLAVLKGHTDSVKDVAFGPDGKTLVTGSADKTVRVWELKE